MLSQLLPSGSPLWRWPLISHLASSSADFFSCGALIQWWTMFSIVAADVAAYFAGKRFGKTALVEASCQRLPHSLPSPSPLLSALASPLTLTLALALALALTKVSPNKTVEGLLGGCLAAMLATTTGAVLIALPPTRTPARTPDPGPHPHPHLTWSSCSWGGPALSSRDLATA